MKKSGSITVFTSLFLAVFLLVFQVLLQSVQIAGGRVQAEAGVEEAKKAEREKSPAFAGGRKTERMERASGAPSK